MKDDGVAQVSIVFDVLDEKVSSICICNLLYALLNFIKSLNCTP